MCAWYLGLRKNLCTIVNTTGEKLQLTPPLEGGIDSQPSLQLFVSPVTREYRNRSESLNEFTPLDLHRVSRRIIPSNPDKIGMVARKGKKRMYNAENIIVLFCFQAI